MKLPLELIALDEVDSTSTRAQELLAVGRVAPFAVWAKRQTAGRGRRGNDWQSPEGNLFLTLVLPGPAAVTPEWGCLPLKAGVIVARAIQEATGVRTTLKWPNDILFAGQKLGGLLLEGSMQGTSAGAVLVGVGLNLVVSPVLNGAYPAISLAEVTGGPQTALDWARRLTDAFSSTWEALPLSDVPQAFAEYAMESGQLWKSSRTGGYARGDLPDRDGALTVTPLAGGPPERLSSVDHDHAWIYQGSRDSAPLLVADVGNTNTKLARFASANDLDPSLRLEVSNDADSPAWSEAVQKLWLGLPTQVWPLHVASVNPVASKRLTDAWASRGGYAVPVPKRPVLLHGKGYRLGDLGIDRLAAMEGWLSSLKASQRVGSGGAVVVCVGTALTADLVLNSGEHLGGYIAPGISTALAALHGAAALLPPVPQAQLMEFTEGPGDHTLAAMRAGAVQMLAGLVEKASAWLRASRADLTRVDVVLTGGGSELIRACLRTEGRPRVFPNLVLHGIRTMVRGGYILGS